MYGGGIDGMKRRNRRGRMWVGVKGPKPKKIEEDRGGDDDIEEIRKPWSMKLTRS